MNIPMIFPSIAAPGFFVNLDADKWEDIGRATLDTLLMVGGALPPALALGLPLGIALYLCNTSQLRRHPQVYTLLALAVNLLRSVPFIILMITMIPVTLLIMGTSLGIRGAILPLVIGAAPFYARLVESALREVDRGVVEAAQAMGATTWQLRLAGPATRSTPRFDCWCHNHRNRGGRLYSNGRRNRLGGIG